MKKKTFYQTNVMWQIVCFMFLIAFIGFFSFGVRLIIGVVRNGLGETVNEISSSLIILTIYFIGCGGLLRVFLRLEHNNVHLTNDKIYMKDDWSNKRDKIQYYSEVKFIDIESIDIIWTRKNSKGKTIKSTNASSYVEKPYISIKNKNGVITNFLVLYIRKKDVVRIINEIRRRMKNVGNHTSIIEDDEVYLKIKRKQWIDFKK